MGSIGHKIGMMHIFVHNTTAQITQALYCHYGNIELVLLVQ